MNFRLSTTGRYFIIIHVIVEFNDFFRCSNSVRLLGLRDWRVFCSPAEARHIVSLPSLLAVIRYAASLKQRSRVTMLATDSRKLTVMQGGAKSNSQLNLSSRQTTMQTSTSLFTRMFLTENTLFGWSKSNSCLFSFIPRELARMG